MTIEQLREWLLFNGKTNEWWINIDGKTLEKTFTLESIESFRSQFPTSRILVLHISLLENLGEPPWIDVDYAPSKPHRTQRNSSKSPKATAPPPPTNYASTSQKKSFWRLLFSFKGRINRKQFIICFLENFAALVLSGLIWSTYSFTLMKLGNAQSLDELPLIVKIWVPIILILWYWCCFSLFSRRLKDTNHSPALLLIFIPVFFFPSLNFLLILVFTAYCALAPTNKRSEEKYGPQYDIFRKDRFGLKWLNKSVFR